MEVRRKCNFGITLQPNIESLNKQSVRGVLPIRSGNPVLVLSKIHNLKMIFFHGIFQGIVMMYSVYFQPKTRTFLLISMFNQIIFIYFEYRNCCDHKIQKNSNSLLKNVHNILCFLISWCCYIFSLLVFLQFDWDK